MSFDWHTGAIDRDTVVSSTYRNTQNVRRFLIQECGNHFKFDRPFMQWVKNGDYKTMGDVAAEWKRRNSK